MTELEKIEWLQDTLASNATQACISIERLIRERDEANRQLAALQVQHDAWQEAARKWRQKFESRDPEAEEKLDYIKNVLAPQDEESLQDCAWRVMRERSEAGELIAALMTRNMVFHQALVDALDGWSSDVEGAMDPIGSVTTITDLRKLVGT